MKFTLLEENCPDHIDIFECVKWVTEQGGNWKWVVVWCDGRLEPIGIEILTEDIAILFRLKFGL